MSVPAKMLALVNITAARTATRDSQ